jgi:hypothetical protein
MCTVCMWVCVHAWVCRWAHARCLVRRGREGRGEGRWERGDGRHDLGFGVWGLGFRYTETAPSERKYIQSP